jgi:hypothetical protein
MPKNEESLFQSMSRFIESGIDPVSKHAEIWERYGETVAVLILDSSGFSRVTESHGIIHFASKLGEDLAIGDETLLTENAYKNAQAHRVTTFTQRQAELSGVTLKHYHHLFVPGTGQ